jgi:geranylgeranyl diphosphate synthase type II
MADVTAERPEQADRIGEQPSRSRAYGEGTGGQQSADRAHVAYPEHLRVEVERYLEGMRFSHESLTVGLEEAMRYSLLAGGKRIRPVLALATARAVGLDQREVLPLAGAIELIHTYSLIHDDLPAMDDDGLRRGMPTCHVRFGEDVAILAGDGLYAEAFRHLLTEQRSPAERVLQAAAELAGATGVDGMVGGQYADVSPDIPDGPAALRRLHELKTGRLIGASVICVLLLGGIDGPATMPYRRFAAELGVLFQIVDDILDVTGTDDALGKPRGSDERHGKRTYVSEFGMERARQLAGESHRTAREALAQAASGGPGARDAVAELEQIADFIYTRTS